MGVHSSASVSNTNYPLSGSICLVPKYRWYLCRYQGITSKKSCSKKGNRQARANKEVRKMTYFMCQYCGYLMHLRLEGDVPAHKCPSCDQSCAFVNVTSYTPEHGAEKNPDPRIMAHFLDGVSARNRRNIGVCLAQRTSVGSDSDDLCYQAALISMRKLHDQLKPKKETE